MTFTARQIVEAGARGRATIPVISALLAIAWLAVLLRSYTRACIVKQFSWDDGLMLVSMIIFSGYCGCLIKTAMLVSLGGDQVIPQSVLMLTLELVIATEIFYLATIMALKLSVGLFYLRIVIKPWLRYMVFAVMIISTTFSTAMILFVIFQCGSFVGISEFMANRVAGKCVHKTTLLGMAYTHGGVTAITDWIYVAIPFFIVHGTTMNRRDKITIGTLMAFASIGAIGALVRFKYIPLLAVPLSTYFEHSADISIWSGVEPGIGITAASAICLRPLLRHHFGCFVRQHDLPRSDLRGPSRSMLTPATGFLVSKTNSKTGLCDSVDNELDWRHARVADPEDRSQTPNWSLDSAPDAIMRAKSADDIDAHTNLPARTGSRGPLAAGLPLETFDKRYSMMMSKWL